MENNKAPIFTLTIVAIILGLVLHKQFDYQNLKFEKPALAAIYMVVLVATVFIFFKNKKKQSEK